MADAQIRVEVTDVLPLVEILHEINNGQVLIMRVLRRIERALIDEGKLIMSELSDALAEVTAALDAHDAELARLLDDFGAHVNGKLDANEKAMFTDLVTRLAASDAVIEKTDPKPDATPVASDSAPADGIGSTTSPSVVDGAQGAGTVGQGADPTAVDSGQHIG